MSLGLSLTAAASLGMQVRQIDLIVDESFSHHQQGRIDFNTVNPSLSTGKDFLIHSV